MNKISENLILFLADSVSISWEIDRETLTKIRKLMDSDSRYLWQPSLKLAGDSTILGFKIVIVKDKCLRLKYKFDDGDEKIFSYNIDDLE